MHHRRATLLAVVLALLLFWTVVPGDRAQSAGSLNVAADYELIGSSQLSGGGHITWTLTGDAAAGLRAKIVHLFDGYRQVPRGFYNAGAPGASTGGNGDGLISLAEGQAYTGAVDRYLENQGAGTQVGYYLLRRAGLFDSSTDGFNRSTFGVLNTNASSTAPMQIEFTTEGATTVRDVMVNLTAPAYVAAIEDVFSFNAEQSPAMAGGSGYAGAWPLVDESNASLPGWHVKPYDATHYALWAGDTSSCAYGNASTCRYAPNANLVTETLTDPHVNLPQGVNYTDLRLATKASVSFLYTGQVTDASDWMTVQVARGPTYSVWNTTSQGNFSAGQNTLVGQWQNESFDLGSYLGQLVRIRLLFHSGAGPPAPGFFVRDFAIHAVSTYTGVVTESDSHYLIGTLSFSNFQTPVGGVDVIRTPGGEILYYSSSFSGASPPDAARFATFDAIENPQILFGVMLVASYFVARLQDSAYEDFRDAHPSVDRPVIRRTKWLHYLGTAAILLLILFYFLPAWPYFLGVKAYVSGLAYWIFAVFVTLALGFGTRAYYNQKLAASKPAEAEERPPASEAALPIQTSAARTRPKSPIAHCTHCLRVIVEDEKTYVCDCGAVYHLTCASGLMRCSTCRKPIAINASRPERIVSMRCASCGEVQTIPEGTDPRTVVCTSCGGSLRPVDAGKRYLLVASNPGIAFRWMTDLARGGKPALCVTMSAPDRLRLEYGLKEVEFLRVGVHGSDSVDPHKLDPVGLKSILPLARAGKGGVLLYDGIEEIVSSASLSDVTRFIRKANDMAFVHGVTVIARVAPGMLASAEIDRLRAEFDEFLDLTARI